MECGRQISRSADQSREAWPVQLTVGADSTGDNPRRLEPRDPRHVFRHRRELVIGVDEGTLSWANYHENWNSYPLEDLLYQRRTGCRPTEVQPSAQIDPLRPRPLGGDGSFPAFNCCLDQYVLS